MTEGKRFAVTDLSGRHSRWQVHRVYYIADGLPFTAMEQEKSEVERQDDAKKMPRH